MNFLSLFFSHSLIARWQQPEKRSNLILSSSPFFLSFFTSERHLDIIKNRVGNKKKRGEVLEKEFAAKELKKASIFIENLPFS
jgi:hypothetical protein